MVWVGLGVHDRVGGGGGGGGGGGREGAAEVRERSSNQLQDPSITQEEVHMLR